MLNRLVWEGHERSGKEPVVDWVLGQVWWPMGFQIRYPGRINT
jgi:hypothetical protein